MKMWITICLLFYLVTSSLTTTSIKTYPTVNLTENSPLHTQVVKLTDKTEMKLILLNLAGFETNLFGIVNGSIVTINEIDREQLVGEKRCFDRSYCLIEVHILVNDGEEYWVIPIHIVDENDNAPKFSRSSIELKFRENIPGGYQIPFEGARDADEGVNGQIRYLLDCSSSQSSMTSERQRRTRRRRRVSMSNETSIGCSPLFELLILSRSTSSNQYDQLALKFLPSSKEKNDYELILYAIDNAPDDKALESSMKINIHIVKQLAKPRFSSSEYEFVIKIESTMKKGRILGSVHAQSNDQTKLISYRIINNNNNNDQINAVGINSLTGELFIADESQSLTNEVDLLVEASYMMFMNDPTLTTVTKVHLYFRFVDRVNEISLDFHLRSSFLDQVNDSFASTTTITKKNKEIMKMFYVNEKTPSNEVLLKFSVHSLFYPFDQYVLILDNYQSMFSLLSSSSLNTYILKTRQSLVRQSIYVLNIRIKHQLTQQWLPNLTLHFIVIDPSTSTTTAKSISESLPPMICEENSTYILRDLNNKSSIRKVQVMESNENVVSFSKYWMSSMNRSEDVLTMDDCQMIFIDGFDDDMMNSSSSYELCSLSSNNCYNVTMYDKKKEKKQQNNVGRFAGSLLVLRPIEIMIFAMTVVFILATVTLMLIVCRLRGIRLCVPMKNYLFYGKKYGLSNAQRLSSAKMTQRVHSIVVRESQSPSIESMKPKVYLFNIDPLVDQEEISTVSRVVNVADSFSCGSSEEERERRRSNVENGTISRPLSSPYIQESRQLLEMMSSNQELNASRLASEV